MTAAAVQPALATQTNYTLRDQLIVEHLPLVTAIALHVQKTLPVHMELDDLRHAGMMGLFEAATKYEADKEIAFKSYAKHRIRGAILDSLRQLDWASRDLRKRQKQFEAVSQSLAEKLNREPNQEEIAQEMGLSSRQWQSMMVDFRSVTLAASQVRANQNDDRCAPLDPPSSPETQPDRVLARRELRTKLDSVVKTLPTRYQQVVSLYYDRDMSMKEIGGVLGVNESRVSQIHKSALAKLQVLLNDAGISCAAN